MYFTYQCIRLILELLFMFRPPYVDLSLLPWDQGCENMYTWRISVPLPSFPLFLQCIQKGSFS